MTEVIDVQDLVLVRREQSLQRLNEFKSLATYSVVDQQSHDYAVVTVKLGREFISEKEAEYKDEIKALYDPYKAKLEEKNKFVKPTEAAIEHLEHVSSKWRRDENERLAKQAAIDAANEALEEQKRIAENQKRAEEEFDPFAVVTVPAIPVPAPPKIYVPTQVAMPAGTSSRKSPLKWRFKENGLLELCKAVAADPKLLDYFSNEVLDAKIMKALISKNGERVIDLIPGIETYRDEQTVTK